MKKSQLRKIIRETIKGLVKEQTNPSNSTPKSVKACPCASIDASAPNGCSAPVTMDVYSYTWSSQYGFQGISMTTGFIFCTGGLVGGGPGSGTCDPQDLYVVMDELGSSTPPYNPDPPVDFQHVHPNNSTAAGCNSAIISSGGDNSHQSISHQICDCQPSNDPICQNLPPGTTQPLTTNSQTLGFTCNGQMCDPNTDIGNIFEIQYSTAVITYELLSFSNPQNSQTLKDQQSSTCPTPPDNVHQLWNFDICNTGNHPNISLGYHGFSVNGQCNGQMCTTTGGPNGTGDIGEIFDISAGFGTQYSGIIGELVQASNPAYNASPLDFPTDTCPAPPLPGLTITACPCAQYLANNNSCGGNIPIDTTYAITIGGNQPFPGDAFIPFGAPNQTYVVDTIGTPTANCPGIMQSFNCDLNPSSCTTPPNPSWDCDPITGCFDPGTGNGQYTTLAACQATCTPPADTYDCDLNYQCQVNTQGTGAYNGGTSAQNLTACQAGCVSPPVDTYDCDSNYQCVVNTQGTGAYSGGTSAQNLAACQTQCISPTPIPGCADPTATPCSQMPPALQNNLGCYDPNHDGCGDIPDPNDTSCCQYSDNNIEPENPDNPTGEKGIYCECCKDNSPQTMVQLYPVGFDCTTLNDPAIGFINCDVSPSSGGPGTNDPNNPEWKCVEPIISPGGDKCPGGHISYDNWNPNFTTPNTWWTYCYPCLISNGILPPDPHYPNPQINTTITGALGNCECCEQKIPSWGFIPEWGDILPEGVKLKGKLLDKLRMSKLANIKKK